MSRRDENPVAEDWRSFLTVEANEIRWKKLPTRVCMFRNITGGERVPAGWTLGYGPLGVSLSESGDFSTDLINLWGTWKTICPEVFYKLNLDPGKSVSWCRNYTVRETK